MRIVKYFNSECNWDHYAQGSFKIGTLAEYRSGEAKYSRMSDLKEGIATDSFGQGGGTIRNIVLPGGHKIGTITGVNVGSVLSVSQGINGYVFCASIGNYSRKHHGKILHGTKSNGAKAYAGNLDLDAYAEIDLPSFLTAIRDWLGTSLVGRNPRRSKFFAHQVTYGDRSRKFDIDPRITPDFGFTMDRLMRTVFVKPEYFSPEAEFRLLMLLNYPMLESDNIKPLFPSSPLLKSSIISMGRW